MTVKLRRTITLDPDVVEALGEEPAGFSATVNAVLRAELDRRRQARALAALVSELDASFGPPDQKDVDRFTQALS